MKRNRYFREPVVDTICITESGSCPYYGKGNCLVPGGVCVYREIEGIEGYFVGDLLERLGHIGPDWEEYLK